MKHLLNNLTSDDKTKILEQYSGGINLSINNFNKLVNNKLGDVKPLINEDNLQGGGLAADKKGTGYSKGELNVQIKQKYTFNKSKMKTGSDDVDTSTTEYQNLVIQLKSILKDTKIQNRMDITVIGGASAVGSSSGYNNEALAKRRAEKLVTQLKNDIPGIDKKFRFIIKSVVGKATKLNSPEAMAEQFVKVEFNANDIQTIKTTREVDNTAINPILPRITPITQDKDGDGLIDYDPTMKRVCIRIPEYLVDEFKTVIRKFKTDNLLSEIPFGVYDIKK
jgi:hypothetical protein